MVSVSMRPTACRACGTVYRAAAGAPCPRCARSSSAIVESVAAPLDEAELHKGEIECPRCAEWIKLKARACRFCGHGLGAPLSPAPPVSKVKEPPSTVWPPAERRSRARDEEASPVVAAILSFFFTGLGQMYSGRLRRGLHWLVAQVTASLIVFFGVLYVCSAARYDYAGSAAIGLMACVSSGIHLVNVVDAYICASSDP